MGARRSMVVKVLVGKRTLVYFAIFFALGVVLPLLIAMTSYGTSDIGFPFAFYHDEGSIPDGRTWTEWDVFLTDLAIYYGLAVVMGLLPHLRRRGE